MNPRGYYAKDIVYEALKPAAEVALFDRVIRGKLPGASKQHRRSGELAQRRIAEAYLLYAARIARQVVGSGTETDDVDVISVANDALLRAIRCFNPRKNTRFSTYSAPFIRGGVTSMVTRLRLRRSQEVTLPESSAARHDPALQVLPMEIIERRDTIREFRKLLAGAEQVLNAQEKQVVHEMLNSDMNFNMSRVAKAIGRSRERVRQIFSAATQKLRLQLEAQGISSL